MRLLVTSPHRGAGYAIVASLRPHCEKLVASVSRGRPAFYKSRLYDRTVAIAAPCDGWIGNGDCAEARLHAKRLLDICIGERLEIVWPSNDAELFALAASKDEFSAHGVTVMAPDYPVLKRISDKYEVVCAARDVGFPVAEARLCTTAEEIAQTLGFSSFPVVVKGRWSTNSSSVHVARTHADAQDVATRLLAQQRAVIVQDFIPGHSERSFHYVISRNHQIVKAFSLRKHRHLAPSYSTAIEVVPPPPELAIGERLLAQMGYTGFCVIQTRIDARDGTHKIIEINPRFGTNSRILFSIDPDLAYTATLINLGNAECKAPTQHPEIGRSGASPIEDCLSIWSLILSRICCGRTARKDLPRLTTYISALLRFYRTRPTLDLHTRALLRDPVATIPYFLGLSRYVVPTRRRRNALRLTVWEEH